MTCIIARIRLTQRNGVGIPEDVPSEFSSCRHYTIPTAPRYSEKQSGWKYLQPVSRYTVFDKIISALERHDNDQELNLTPWGVSTLRQWQVQESCWICIIFFIGQHLTIHLFVTLIWVAFHIAQQCHRQLLQAVWMSVALYLATVTRHIAKLLPAPTEYLVKIDNGIIVRKKSKRQNDLVPGKPHSQGLLSQPCEGAS